MSPSSDFFDDLLGLEETFHKEGYERGVEDGKNAGRIEGRLLGLEKGFEKHTTMGEMHGRALLWASRTHENKEDETNNVRQTGTPSFARLQQQQVPTQQYHSSNQNIQALPAHARLNSHLRLLLSLTAPSDISTSNDDDTVTAFDEKLKRAEGKVKVIERIVGESDGAIAFENTQDSSARGNSGIEDTGNLRPQA